MGSIGFRNRLTRIPTKICPLLIPFKRREVGAFFSFNPVGSHGDRTSIPSGSTQLSEGPSFKKNPNVSLKYMNEPVCFRDWVSFCLWSPLAGVCVSVRV